MDKVVLANASLEIRVLPELGGKLASLKFIPTNTELLQQPLAPYRPRTMLTEFEDSDASGFDECLPSVSACSVETDDVTFAVPDHGDFWRLPWHCRKTACQIHMKAVGRSLPLQFEKMLILRGSSLEIMYRLTNVGKTNLPYIWSAHPLFAADAGDRIVLPRSITSVRVDSSIGERFEGGSTHPWPLARMRDGLETDLSIVGCIHSCTGDMLYSNAPAEGWAALERVQEGIRIEVRFRPSETPYLGLWLCYGGWPESKAVRQQCVSIQPCTAARDSLSQALGEDQAIRLAPGAVKMWKTRLEVIRIAHRYFQTSAMF